MNLPPESMLARMDEADNESSASDGIVTPMRTPGSVETNIRPDTESATRPFRLGRAQRRPTTPAGRAPIRPAGRDARGENGTDFSRPATARVDRSDLAEEVLLKDSRAGDPEAFAELFRRHRDAAIRIASRTSRSVDPQDVTAEAFARVWSALCKGGGPDRAFRAYLATAVRHVALNWCRDGRETATDPDQFLDVPTVNATSTAIAEAELVETAFADLPERWRQALWATEVEGVSVAEFAATAGISANAAAALCLRAREGLKVAWLQAHINRRSNDPECQWVLDHLGSHSRGRLPALQRKRVEDHLEDCERCETSRVRLAYIASALKACTLFASTGGAFLAAKAAFGAGGAAAGTGAVLLAKPVGEGAYVWAYTQLNKAGEMFTRPGVGSSPARMLVAGAAAVAVIGAAAGFGMQQATQVSSAAGMPLTMQNQALVTDSNPKSSTAAQTEKDEDTKSNSKKATDKPTAKKTTKTSGSSVTNPKKVTQKKTTVKKKKKTTVKEDPGTAIIDDPTPSPEPEPSKRKKKKKPHPHPPEHSNSRHNR